MTARAGPGCSPVHPRALAQRALGPLLLAGSPPDRQRCSIGVAAWDGAAGAGTLVARADAARYEAKLAGRDRVHLRAGAAEAAAVA